MKNPKNMKELLEYAIHRKAERSLEYRVRLHSDPENICGGFTLKEWKKVVTPQKKSFTKGKKAAYTKIWRYLDEPIKQ